MAVARVGAFAGEPRRRRFENQFTSAVERRPLSARHEGPTACGWARRRLARERGQAGPGERRQARRQTTWREGILALSADRGERGSRAPGAGVRRVRSAPRLRPEAPLRQRPQQPRTHPRRHVYSSLGDPTQLLRRALFLRSRQCRTPSRRIEFSDRRPQTELTDERALPGGSHARHFHRRVVAALPSFTAQDQEFLRDWLDLELSTATIERCIHEFGLASEPVVERLVEDVRAAPIVHLDETPWYQRGALLWMWVAVTATTIVYRIGSRRKEELTALIGDAFLGWLVTDGYGAYRDHPRRQRCLAHLIRKALALAEGYYGVGSGFGRDLVRDLRRLIERVHDGADADALGRLTNRIKWNCQCNRYEIEKKVRDLAGEILNDWGAVIAFVADPNLPPTNNDAERALRHAVIARRISYGTRTDEGSRFYAAGLSIIDTCRKRGVEPWTYACSLIAAARADLTLPMIPAKAAA